MRLGDVAEVDRGLSWAREQESPIPLPDTVPVVRIGNVQPEGFRMDDMLYIRGVSEADRRRRAVTPATLVMVGSNGNRDRVGNVFLADYRVVGHVLASFLIRIMPGTQVAEQFLAATLRSHAIQAQITESTAGSTGLKNLSLKWLRSLPILLPPPSEQRAIAAVLDSIDDAIEDTEAVIAATERLRDSLLHELLTRGVPGWHTEWKEAPGVGTIPADWDVVRLGDVAAVNRSQWDPMEGSSILYLDLTAVPAPGRLSSPIEFVAEDAPSRARRRVQAGDVLVSTVRPYLRGFARVLEAPPNLIASTGFAVLTPLPKVDKSLIYHHVMAPSFAQHLEASMTGQAYPAVRPSDVTSYRVALPPAPEQQIIATMLDAVDDAIERRRGEQDGLQSLKASAADALLTGRVRVGTT